MGRLLRWYEGRGTVKSGLAADVIVHALYTSTNFKPLAFTVQESQHCTSGFQVGISQTFQFPSLQTCLKCGFLVL